MVFARTRSLPVLLALLVAPAARSQETPPPDAVVPAPAPDRSFRLRGELKLDFRDSHADQFRLVLPNGNEIFQRTVSPHASFEVQNLTLAGEGEVADGIEAKVEVHFLDLYNRNPTSSDDRVAVREAWLRFGEKPATLKALPGSTLYLQARKSSRFSKQLVRRLESYGLWGTAVGRFEEVGLEAGGSLGAHLYFRLQAVNGNPLFMRDTNALAGDNGTPERRPGSTEPTVYESGFPILYDAKSSDLNFDGRFQAGAGLGLRFVSADERRGVDFLAWAFQRTLAERASIRGTYYGGDVDLLDGLNPVSLPLDGRRKLEVGANLSARWNDLSFYGQFVRQDIAGLVRKGYEVELAYRLSLGGLFAWRDTPVGNWLQPSVRVSKIQNEFANPSGFVRSVVRMGLAEDRRGFRLGIVRGVDVTVEYSRHDMILRSRVLHPDELLVTLRAAF